jgi:hypothetical protein
MEFHCFGGHRIPLVALCFSDGPPAGERGIQDNGMAAIRNHAWEIWEIWEHWGQWNSMAANENGNP